MWGVIGLDRSEVDMNGEHGFDQKIKISVSVSDFIDPMAEFLGDPEYDPQFDLTDTKAQVQGDQILDPLGILSFVDAPGALGRQLWLLPHPRHRPGGQRRHPVCCQHATIVI